MDEDPAITEAKKLWRKQRQAEAVKVLIRRINELNTRTSTSIQPLRHPRPAKRIPRWVRLVMGLGVVMLCFAVASTIWDWQQQGAREERQKRIHEDAEAEILKIHYSVFCEFYILDDEEFCDSWAERLVTYNRKEAEACEDTYGEMTWRCLEDHYVQVP